MDLVLIRTSEIEGKNGKKEEKTDYFAGVDKLSKTEYTGDDPRIEYYNTKGEVGFVERTEADKKIAERAGFHWNPEKDNMHAQEFEAELPKRVDAYQKQQAFLNQKKAERMGKR